MAKSRDAFRTISEVAEWLDTPAHVLRFWESKFSQVKPVKRAGGRRYYRPEDMKLLSGIKALLHDQGLTIKGAQKLLREKGVKHVAALGRDPDVGATDANDDLIEATANQPTEAPATSATADIGSATDIDPDGTAQALRGAAAPMRPHVTLDLPNTPRKVAAPAVDTPLPTAGQDDAEETPEAADVLPFAPVRLISERRTGRIPALPTNPGAFARPGPLSAILKARRGSLTDRASHLAPLVAQLRQVRHGMMTRKP